MLIIFRGEKKNGKNKRYAFDIEKNLKKVNFEPDEILARLTTFNNVMIASDIGFLTNEALTNIAKTTIENISEYEKGKRGSQLTNTIIKNEFKNLLFILQI